MANVFDGEWFSRLPTLAEVLLLIRHRTYSVFI